MMNFGWKLVGWEPKPGCGRDVAADVTRKRDVGLKCEMYVAWFPLLPAGHKSSLSGVVLLWNRAQPCLLAPEYQWPALGEARRNGKTFPCIILVAAWVLTWVQT